jgi:hypothetical protein
MKNKLFNSITVFTTGMSAIDWFWKLFTLLIIGGSGTTSAILASESPFFKELGAVAWIFVGLVCGLSVTLIFYLIKSAESKSAHAEYTRSVSQPKNHVNPLNNTFKDQLIPIEELRIPGVQIHENKHFKGCSFVGPGSIALLGGNFVRTNFNEIGDIIPIPDNTYLTGIILLKNCTVEDCNFYRTTIMVSATQADQMAAAVQGIRVAGK